MPFVLKCTHTFGGFQLYPPNACEVEITLKPIGILSKLIGGLILKSINILSPFNVVVDVNAELAFLQVQAVKVATIES